MGRDGNTVISPRLPAAKTVRWATDSSVGAARPGARTGESRQIRVQAVAARLQHWVAAMPTTAPRIGVACLNTAERAAFADWLRMADLEPLLLVEACLVNADVSGKGLECVIADASLLRREYLMELRRLDPRLPIIAIGDQNDPTQRDLERRDVRFYPRPVEMRTLLLAVSLSIAESRPVRRSLRRLVPRLPSTIDGANAVLLDVSGEGLRVEVAKDQGAHLAPMFHLRVPMFKVGVTVRRIWVGPGSQGPGRVQCGASLIEADERAMRTWKALIENVGTGESARGALRPPPAKVEKERVLGRLGQFLAEAPLVSGLSLPWRQGGRPS